MYQRFICTNGTNNSSRDKGESCARICLRVKKRRKYVIREILSARSLEKRHLTLIQRSLYTVGTVKRKVDNKNADQSTARLKVTSIRGDDVKSYSVTFPLRWITVKKKRKKEKNTSPLGSFFRKTRRRSRAYEQDRTEKGDRRRSHWPHYIRHHVLRKMSNIS